MLNPKFEIRNKYEFSKNLITKTFIPEPTGITQFFGGFYCRPTSLTASQQLRRNRLRRAG